MTINNDDDDDDKAYVPAVGFCCWTVLTQLIQGSKETRRLWHGSPIYSVPI